MPIIRPISDLRDTNEVSRLAIESNEYMDEQEIYRKLAVGEAQIINGAQLIDAKKALKELRAEYAKRIRCCAERFG